MLEIAVLITFVIKPVLFNPHYAVEHLLQAEKPAK